MTLEELYANVTTFHQQNHLPIHTGTRQGLLFRLALMQEELGEISSVVTKSPTGCDRKEFTQDDWDHFTEEMIDLLYLWTGTAVELGWLPEEIIEAFHKKHAINLQRALRHHQEFSLPPEPLSPVK